MNPHLPLTEKVTATYQNVHTVNRNNPYKHKADWSKLKGKNYKV